MSDTDYSQKMPPANMVLVVILIGLTGVLGWQVWQGDDGKDSSDFQSRKVTPRGSLTPDEQENISVFQTSSPSVVFIQTLREQDVPRSQDGSSSEQSSGTGIVWDNKGHIITNLHVILESIQKDKSSLEVQFADRTTVRAEVVGGVLKHDIAVLKVDVDPDLLVPITLGTSNDLLVGQKVLAIGSPFGFDQTLSTGVIGGLNRNVENDNRGILAGLIQTDAAINPGNSGGPLLDSSGRMIGITTAIVSPTGAYSGLGFAVPVGSVISSVNLVLERATEKVPTVLGATVFPPDMLRRIRVREELLKRGAYIAQIVPNGPAATAGLQPARLYGYSLVMADQITAIDGQKVRDQQDIDQVLEDKSPGDTVKLTIIRANTEIEVPLVLESQKLFF